MNLRCHDCGREIETVKTQHTSATIGSSLVYDEGERRDVYVCDVCLDKRIKKMEQECGEKDWAIPHG